MARTDEDIATGLTLLLHQLDEPKQKLLLQKLRAVSPKANVAKEPMVMTWFIQAIKQPSLAQLLQNPEADQILMDATSDPQLSQAREILLGHILPPPSPSSPLTSIRLSLKEAKSKLSSSKDTTSAIGLALVRYVSCRQGLELPPHVQLVNLLLGTSPLHLHLNSDQNSSPAFDSTLLLQVANDLASADPQQKLKITHQGELDQSLHASLLKRAAADEIGPASKLLSIISDLRRHISFSSPLANKNALLPQSACGSDATFSIIPSIAINTTEDELRSLSEAQRTSLSHEVHKINGMGRALEGLLPKHPYSTSKESDSSLNLIQILNLPLETRLALAWTLRTEEAAALSTPSLLSLLRKSSLHRRLQYEDEAGSFMDLLSAFSLEKTVAELDLVSPPRPLVPEGKGAEGVLSSYSERYGPNAPSLPPSDAELYRLFSSKSEAMIHEASPFEALIEGQKSSLASRDAFKVLVQEGLEGQEDPGSSKELDPPSTLREFFSQAKINMNRLTPKMLALLARFSSFQIRVGRKEAMEAQETARSLLSQVVDEIHKTDRLACARASLAASSRQLGSSSSSTEVPPSLMSPLSGSIVPIDPNLVSAILRSDHPSSPPAFKSWLKSNLSQSAANSFASTGEGGLQPYDILAEQHLAMDFERYLAMRRAPELSISFDTLPSSCDGDEASFLLSCREILDGYLEARGMERMTQVEWEAYSAQSLAEHEAMREEHEAAMREVMGTSSSSLQGSRAEEEHLRARLAAGVTEESPIYEQAKGYLDVLLANPSWSFAQREAVVERLCELSKHFSDKKTRALLRGSPLGPLFATKEDEAAPLVPKLKRK